MIRARAGTLAAEDVCEKSTNDLVTAIDEAAQSLIETELTDAFPSYDILSEEDERTDPANPVADGHRWIIDPLDGTTNFTFDAPPYAVSIALQQGRDLVVGVVLDVPAGTLYTAVRGNGTFIGTARGVRRHGAAAIDLAQLAAGAYTGFFETGLNPWDVAAGILLIEEAGGRVTDFKSDPDALFASQMVASNGHIHDAILEVVHPIRDMR